MENGENKDWYTGNLNGPKVWETEGGREGEREIEVLVFMKQESKDQRQDWKQDTHNWKDHNVATNLPA